MTTRRGAYRPVYRIDADSSTVEIVRIGHGCTHSIRKTKNQDV
ncbi:MAG: type II toxin-antitoxin system RelE/ParE family toxin [Acidimicrobiia bacterium]